MPKHMVGDVVLIELAGTPAEMGREYGLLCKPLIRQLTSSYIDHGEAVFGVPKGILLESARHLEAFVPRPFKEEMAGMAETSGVAYEKILALNCIADVDAYHLRNALQCCNFVLAPPRTREDVLLHGRNLDFPPVGQFPGKCAILILRRSASSQVASTLSVTWAGFVGTLTGMSSRKISCAEVSTPSRDVSLDGVPIAFLLRDILERSASCEDACRIASDAPITGGYNIAVADGKSMQSMAIEVTHSLRANRRARRGVLVVDDLCLCKATAMNRLAFPAGVVRYCRMMQLITGAGTAVGELEALALLRDRFDLTTNRTHGRTYNCICNRHTVTSVLFKPFSLDFYVSYSNVPAPAHNYTFVSMSEFGWQK